jgi:hypothetical protein
MFSFVLPFCQKYWKQIAYAALIAIIFLTGYYKGYSHEKAKFDAFVQAQRDLAIAQQAKNELIKQNQDSVLVQSSNDYNDTIKRITNYYAKNKPDISVVDKLHNIDTNANTMPNIQEATTRVTKIGTNIDAMDIEQTCAVTTAQYNALWDAWSDLCKVSGCD